MNNHFDPYYIGVDPNMYGSANLMNPMMQAPYGGTPMMSIGSNQGHPPPMMSPNDMHYPGSAPSYGFPGSSHHASGSTSTTQDYEEEISGDDRGMSHYAYGGTHISQSLPNLGGPSRAATKESVRSSRSSDGGKDSHDEENDSGQPGDSPKKKPRITLARGGACVNCRNRKLKCTGEKPCKTCKKGGIDCKYEELTRRRPRAVLMEERVVELEQLLAKSGIPVPPSPLHPPGTNLGPFALLTPQYSPATDSFPPRPTSSHSSSASTSFVLPPAMRAETMTVGTNQTTINIPPNSALELGLINVILPYTPYISIPVHPARFLALLTLPSSHPSRPHPALLYILFAEAVRVIEGNVPLPQPQQLPPGMFGPGQSQTQTPIITTPNVDRAQLYGQVHGTSLSLLERAQRELNEGIRNVDRPFDLVRAALGISRYLYTLGRFIEGWNIPVARLAITCGLHRLTGAIVSPGSSTQSLSAHTDVLPQPYDSTGFYKQHQEMMMPIQPSLPILRKAPIILPPARDAIDVAERSATWWAVRGMDWSASIGWGWVAAVNDSDCTSELPWGWGIPTERNNGQGQEQYTIADLFDASSSMHVQRVPESTYKLSLLSLCLLQTASSLFDRPSKRYASFSTQPSEFMKECTSLETACANLRKRIPPAFQYPRPTISPHDLGSPIYDGASDPWWIQLHIDLYTTEMLLHSQLASYRSEAYEQAISAARAVVPLVRQIRNDQWARIEMVTPICLSLVARFLNKESARLAAAGQARPAGMAAEDAETLRVTLERDIAPWLPMAGLHAMIVRRVKEGWPEKEGEYERV